MSASTESDNTGAIFDRRRTTWDIVLGVLVVIAGLFVLGHTVLATLVSVLFLGWLSLVVGLISVVGALFRIGKDGFWSAALSGGLFVVLGLMLLRNPGAAAFSLTLVAGALFLGGGITRIIAGAAGHGDRWALIGGGAVSVLLGLIVVFNLFETTLTLLGTLVGVQLIVEGLLLITVGRLQVVRKSQARGGSTVS